MSDQFSPSCGPELWVMMMCDVDDNYGAGIVGGDMYGWDVVG